MFTTFAYSESQDNAGAFAKIAGVSDQHIKVDGDSVYINEYNRIVAAMACMGNTVPGEVRLTAPSIRGQAPYYIHPIIDQIYPTTYPGICIMKGSPLQLVPDEQLEVESDANPAAAEQHSVIIWAADSEIVPVSGKIFTVKATVTLTGSVGVWVFAALTFVDDLPVGNYDIVGMHVEADEAVAARLVPVAGEKRPGVPCVASKLYHIFGQPFRYGNFGVFCSFKHSLPPNIEILFSADEAEDTYDVYLDIIKK